MTAILRTFVKRTVWMSIVLADIVAMLSVTELIHPHDRNAAFVWNSGYDWAPVITGVVCGAVITAGVSMLWRIPLNITDSEHATAQK